MPSTRSRTSPASSPSELAGKRDLLVDGLNQLGLPTYRPQGTYFAISDVSDTDVPDGMDFCLSLPERAGVVAIPAGVFYDDAVSRPPPGPLGLLQAADGPRGGARTGWREQVFSPDPQD